MLERFVIADKSGAAVAYTVLQQTFKHATLPLGTEVVKYADAQATIAALQARVQELEARQHFGACAKCLTNAWRICKEGTPDAVEMKCSNGSTWWLCDYCLSKEQLTQRTAELEAAKAQHKDLVLRNRILRDRPDLPVERTSFHDEVVKLQAELERVRGLVRALPAYKDISVSHRIGENDYESWHVWVDHNPLAECDTEEEANAIKALYEHRQGMEG